jgi:uncharacterized membrane protein
VVTTSSPSANIKSASAESSQTLQAPRLVSVDLLRGLVMVIMALDHTRDYFTNLTFEPEDLSHTYGVLFFTRFITHFCAPVFSLLAGTGAYLAVSRGKTIGEVSRFFWTRGLWLIFLEFTIIGFGWAFTLPLGLAGVIWVLGLSMVVMALVVRLPIRWIAAFGILMVAGHNLLDGISADSLEKFSWLWTILHATPGMIMIKPPQPTLFVLYPLIPWVGVMACGYAMGALLLRPDRRKIISYIGLALTATFFVLRGINHYGNGTTGYPFSTGHWASQPTAELTAISFLNTLKYPPSLDYLLMTLGPALMVLAWFDTMRAEQRISRILLPYGRVPMFYYVVHIYLIHSMAVLVAWFSHQPATWLWHGAFFLQPRPADYGHDLPFVYLMWVIAVAILYFPCRWFMEFKQQHRDWRWLSYL